MSFHLNTEKTIQAAGVLLQSAGRGEMSYLRLIKLLYIADRETMQQTGRPITGDRYAAMDHGPVLSGVYDMIKQQHLESKRWFEFIGRENYQVQLIASPGNGELSRFEVQKLQEVWDRYEDFDDWYIVENVAHEFPEWIDNKPTPGSAKPITHSEILDRVGRGDDKDEIMAEEKSDAALDRLMDELSR